MTSLTNLSYTSAWCLYTSIRFSHYRDRLEHSLQLTGRSPGHSCARRSPRDRGADPSRGPWETGGGAPSSAGQGFRQTRAPLGVEEGEPGPPILLRVPRGFAAGACSSPLGQSGSGETSRARGPQRSGPGRPAGFPGEVPSRASSLTITPQGQRREAPASDTGDREQARILPARGGASGKPAPPGGRPRLKLSAAAPAP